MKKLTNIINAIYWFFYKLTPKGKKAFILKEGFKGLQKSKLEGNLTKFSIIGSANKLLKTKKILAFHKGSSIAKPKKSNHQVIETVKHKHADDLKEKHLKITKKGKFVNA